jgi:hypothetical protein
VTKWEYKVLKAGMGIKGVNAEEVEEELNLWGEEGWELVSLERQQSSILAVLKRSKSTPRRREPKDRWF